jgi:DNA polymerase III delta prime subunit
MNKEVIWNEKYRPFTIEECILPKRLKSKFLAIKEAGEIQQHFLFNGSRGVGKTTAARALCNDTDSVVHFINSSLYGNIDRVRGDITNFASSASITGRRKVVILDEADHMTRQAQAALRAFIEQFSRSCSFILTCNYKNRIIPELSDSRCSVIDFDIGGTPDDIKELVPQIYKRITYILSQENIDFKKKVLLEYIISTFPDMRKMINDLQQYSLGKDVIDVGILSKKSEDKYFEKIIIAIKEKKFDLLRKFVFASGDTV